MLRWKLLFIVFLYICLACVQKAFCIILNEQGDKKHTYEVLFWSNLKKGIGFLIAFNNIY